MLRRLAIGISTTLTLAGDAALAQSTCGATGAAPSCSPAGPQVVVTVQAVVFLSITSPSFTLTAPTDLDFVASGTTIITDPVAQDATVSANAPWTLTLQGAPWTGTGNNAKAVGDLEYTQDGGASWTTTTTSPVSLQTGVETAGTTVSVGYQTTWRLASDTPGTYTMPLTFTVSSP